MKIAIYIEDKPNGQFDVTTVITSSQPGNAEWAAKVAVHAIRKAFAKQRDGVTSHKSLPGEDQDAIALGLLKEYRKQHKL